MNGSNFHQVEDVPEAPGATIAFLLSTHPADQRIFVTDAEEPRQVNNAHLAWCWRVFRVIINSNCRWCGKVRSRCSVFHARFICIPFASRLRALSTETKVESGSSQKKSGTSINSNQSGELLPARQARVSSALLSKQIFHSCVETFHCRLLSRLPAPFEQREWLHSALLTSHGCDAAGCAGGRGR